MCAELLKGHADPSFYTALAATFEAVWTHGIPAAWNSLGVTSIHKKGDPTLPDNYRGIAVMAAIPKLLAHTLLARLEHITE